MGAKIKDLSKLEIPGPGQYESNFKVMTKAMPAFSITGRH